MTVTFYKTTDDPKKLVKSLTPIGQTYAHPLSPTAEVNLLNPTIVIDYNAEILAANYCKIDTFDRYYWVDFGVTTAGRTVVNCSIDPLMSFAGTIKSCPACIVRAEIGEPTYVVDDKLPIDPSRVEIKPYDFPGDPLAVPATEHYKYLLITNGGAES